jgi:hypothetical protein
MVPVWASNQEFLVNAEATAANYGLLQAINNGARPQRFADGGPISGLPPAGFMGAPVVTPEAIRSALDGMSLDVALTGSDRGKASFVQDGINAGARLE